MRSWDNMVQVQVRVSRGRPTGVAVKAPDFKASIEENMDVFVNGGQRSVPTSYKSNEVYSLFVKDGTQIVMQLADGTRISVVKIGNLRNVYVSAVRDTFWKNSAGLLGVYDNNQGNDMIKSNHVLISADRINADTTSQFVTSWKATGTDLFMRKFIGYPKNKYSSAAPLNTHSSIYQKILNRANKKSVSCGATGDPHYTTYDGKYYHMIRDGDFIFTEHISKSFAVHVRTKRYPAGHVAVAVYSKGDVLEYFGGYSGMGGKRFELNGKKINPGRNGIRMASGAMVYQKGNTGEVVDPRGIKVQFNTNQKVYIPVYVYLTNPKFTFNKMYGLCGDFDRDSGNDLTYKGKQLAIDKPSERFRWRGEKVWGTEYKVDTRHSLFDMPYTPSKNVAVRKWKNDQEKKKAESTCKKAGLSGNDHESCVDDIQATGDFSLAAVSKESKQSFDDAKHRFLSAKPTLDYPLKEMRGNRAIDTSGNGRDGVFYGDIEVLKGAMDARGGRMEVKKPGAITGKEMSAAMWLNVKSTKSGSNIITVKDSWSVNSYPNGNRYALIFQAGNTQLKKVVLSYGKWYYITVTYETGEAASIYVNGKVQEFVNKNVKVQSSTKPLDVAGPGLKARINSVLVYDFSLEEEQVHGLYHVGDDVFSGALSKIMIAQKKITADKQKAVKEKQVIHNVCLGVQKKVQTSMDAQTANVKKITNNVKTLQAQTDEASENKNAATKSVATLNGKLDTHAATCKANLKTADTRATVEREIVLINDILTKFKKMKTSNEKGAAEYLLEKLRTKLKAALKKVDAADAVVAACPRQKAEMKTQMLQLVKNDASTGQKLKDQEKLLSQEIEIQNVATKAANAVETQLTAQTTKCKGFKQETQATVRSYDAQINDLQAKIDKIVQLRKK